MLAAGAVPGSVDGGDGAGAKRGAAGLRLLVAEDNAVNSQLALALLRKLGYDADVVENGREALDALERESYDVVLMDIQMPELDGLEATREIRRRFGPKDGPAIIAMTANAMEGDREECLAAGMNDYLSKPIRADDLSRALARWGRAPALEVAGQTALATLAAALGGGDEGRQAVAELVATFLEDAPVQIAALRDALERGDAGEAQRAAHTLKSNGATFGARTLAELCRSLEALCREGRLDGAPELLGRIEEEWGRVSEELAGPGRAGVPHGR